MTHRRDFLAALWTAGVAGMPAAAPRTAVTVSAHGTVFHGHPDARSTLVRFVAEDADQPAGRLRAFDRRGRLLGTAGMLGGAGGRLAGELWVPLDGETRLRSELEMPGTRTPIVTWHTVVPGPRWIIEWHTLADPADLAARLDHLAPVPRAAAVAGLLRAAVRVNPLRGGVDPLLLDHTGLLRITVPSARAAAAYAMPLANVVRARDAVGIPSISLALTGVGVTGILDLDATPDALGFGLGRGEMARRVEGWLAARGEEPAGEPDRRAVVIGGALDRVEAAAVAVADWNAAYAYPRIAVGGALPEAGDGVPPVRQPVVDLPETDTGHLAAVRGRRAARRAERREETFTTLARLLVHDAEGTAGIAGSAALPFAGLLVFNGTPFTRSGPVLTPGGTTTFATSVPGMGYAWLPHEPAADDPEPPAAGTLRMATPRWSVEIGSEDGALRSLRDAAGREWAGPDGLNAIAGARLDEVTVQRVPGGRRLTARRITFRGAILTHITAYDALPHLEIVNDSRAVGTDPLAYRFTTAVHADRVRWEVPGGSRAGNAPVALTDLYRWVALDGAGGSVMFATADTPLARVDAAGTLTYRAPHGICRYVLDATDPPSETRPWQLAADVEPLIGIETPGDGPAPIPTFGRLVAVDEPGVHVAGIKPADDGLGAIVYIQETLGIPRQVMLSGELLRFDAAFRCDYAERDLESLDLDGESLVAVSVERHGFSAVRLMGLSVGR